MILALWSSLMLATSPGHHLMIEAETVPGWVREEWEATSAALDLDVEAVTQLSGRHTLEAGELDIIAEAWPGRIDIHLNGSGWLTPNARNTAILQQNLAHELAHILQLHWGDPQRPRWWHEGLAEAMSMEMLVGKGPWTNAQYRGWVTQTEETCADRLYEGPLAAPRDGADDAADYACGYVMVTAVGLHSGLSAQEIAQRWGESTADLDAFIEEVTNAEFAASLRAFRTRDLSYLHGPSAIRILYAGRH